jgi:hypothetical protein
MTAESQTSGTKKEAYVAVQQHGKHVFTATVKHNNKGTIVSEVCYGTCAEAVQRELQEK